MLLVNEFKRPQRLNLYEVPESNDSLEREDFDYPDPHGFKLNIAEQEFYKASNKLVHPFYGNWHDTMLHMDLDHPNEASFSNRFLLTHSYTQYRCNFKGAAYEAIKTHAICGLRQAQILLQLRPKWGISFQLYAKNGSGCNTLYELLSLDYNYISYTEFNNSADAICNKLTQLDWDKYADEIWDRREEWELLSLYDQRQWKCKLVLGLDNHYTHITSLK